MIVGCTSAYAISSCYSVSCEFDLLGVGLLFSLWVLQVSSTNKSDLQDITAIVMKEEVEDTTGVIRICKSEKDR
jgi:hypothetical protein